MRILAIDQGTSGTKAVVVDDDGTVVASAECAVRPQYLPDGGVEQDPGELLDSVLDSGREAVKSAGGAIDVIALANQGETVLAWDPRTGETTGPALVWQDGRSSVVCDELKDHADLIAQRTGLVLDPYFSAPKMSWLRQAGVRGGVITTSDTWLIHQLTGEFVTDATTASRSLLLDLDQVQWDEELSGVFGLSDEPLPRIVDCDAVVGETNAFGVTTAVGGLIVDQQAALIAESCLDEGSAKCTYGTGAFLLATCGSHPTRSRHGLTTSVAWRTRDSLAYCMDGQVYTAASVVRWLVDIGILQDIRALDDACAEDSGGVLFVPALAGLAAPWWRANARGSFSQLSLATSSGALVRAVVDGLAAQVAELVEVVDADLGTPIEALRVDGGLTRSRALMQAQADLLQRPVEVYASADATALGAAVMGRLALSSGLTLRDAGWTWTPAAVYEPRWSPDRAAEHRARFRAAVAHDMAVAP